MHFQLINTAEQVKNESIQSAQNDFVSKSILVEFIHASNPFESVIYHRKNNQTT